MTLVIAGTSYDCDCMATMIPSTVKDFHGSKGEEIVFLALRRLPEGNTIIHSFRWLHPGGHRSVTTHVGAQGEGDFVVFDPKQGIMVIEVKGGDIWCERGEWRQRNRKTGAIFSISPEEQAGATVHRIREEIQARISAGRSLLFCHAIWFPEGMPDRANLPMNCPSEIVLDEEDIGRPVAAVQRAFAYWHKALPNRGGICLKDAQKVLDALAPTFSLVPSVRRSLDDREAQLVQLTHEQAKVVHFLDEQRHAAIHGAAGTGKTMVALEKARRLASPSEPVLFLCYNSALQAHLQTHHSHPNVRYATFHSFARELIGSSGSLEEAEQALLVHLIEDRPIPYVHLIIDEGQDFKADWLEYLAHRFRDGAFYVFYDRHQLVQGGDLKWLEDIPCRLVLSRTQAALRTGELVNRQSRHVIRKAIGGWRDVSDPNWRAALKCLTVQLKDLRGRLVQGRKDGRIIEKSGYLHSTDRALMADLDSRRQQCLDMVRQVLSDAGLPTP
jgi:hypothetical protein